MKRSDELARINVPSLENYIKDPVDTIGSDEQYSIFKYSRRQENEIAEIASALGPRYIYDLIPFKVRRLFYFETIVTLETEVRLRGENDLLYVVHQTYGNFVVPLLKSIDTLSGNRVEVKLQNEVVEKIQKQVDLAFEFFIKISAERQNQIITNIPTEIDAALFNEICEVYDEIKKRIESGLHIPGECSFDDDHNSVTKKIVFDRAYNKIMPIKVKELIKPFILFILDKQVLFYPETSKTTKPHFVERLSSHQEKERHTFMVIGAPGSGKGSSYGMIMIDALKLGVDFADMVKVNTDFHRNLVSNERELGPDKKKHSGLNGDESYIITQMVYKELEEKTRSSRGAPHILIDTVYPNLQKIELATAKRGQLHLYCITVTPEISLRRAFLRGESTGRYIDTSFLLQSHGNISRDFHKILIQNKGKNIDYTLVDNSEEIPVLIEEGNVEKKRIKVHNVSKLIQFLKKGNTPITTDLTFFYINPLKEAGFSVSINSMNKFKERSSNKTNIYLATRNKKPKNKDNEHGRKV